MTNDNQRRPNLLQRILALSALLVVVALLAGFIALRSFRLPAPTGPYTVGTTILNLTDESRHEDHVSDPAARRELVAQVWYPASPSNAPFAPYKRWAEAPLATIYAPLLQTNSHLDAPFASSSTAFPVLIFGHRWNGQRTQNTDLAEDLASHGYVVVSVDHPYNSARVELGDGRIVKGHEDMQGPHGAAASAADQIAFWDHTLDLWAKDDLFVLDQLAARSADRSSLFYGKLDTDHAGAFGHSFGGAVALYLCGLDPRIKSGVNLDGWTFGGLDHRTASQPVMILYEHVTVDRRKQLASLPQPGPTEDQLDRADFAAVDRSLSDFGGYRMYIAGTQHLDFSDQPLLPPLRRLSYTGPIKPMEIQTILRESVLAFFNQTLRNQTSPLLASPHSTFSEVTTDTSLAQSASATVAVHPTPP